MTTVSYRRVRGPLFLIVATLVLAPGTSGFAYERPGVHELISTSSSGEQGHDCPESLEGPCTGSMWQTSISPNGRFVAFATAAQGLVAGDNNRFSEVFLKDRRTGTTKLVSGTFDGGGGIRPPDPTEGIFRSYGDGGGDSALSYDPSVSANGRYVAFTSHAMNLVPGDTNLATDVFVNDTKTGQTARVSVSSKGDQGMELCATCPYNQWVIPDSFYPSMSANGRFVSFASLADNLVDADTNGTDDVFVHDRESGETTRVSVASDGSQSAMQCETRSLVCLVPDQWQPRSSISADGRFVAFDSDASDLVSDDTNNVADIFVHDRESKETERVSVNSAGEEARDDRQYINNWANSGSTLGASPYTSTAQRTISADGRYVVFASSAENLVPHDANTDTVAFRATHPDGVDIFVRDRKLDRTRRVSVGATGLEAGRRLSAEDAAQINNNLRPSISADGRFVTWAVMDIQNLTQTPADNRGVMLHDLLTNSTEFVSWQVGDECSSPWVVLSEASDGGRFVAFSSPCKHIEQDHFPGADIYVRHRGAPVESAPSGIRFNKDLNLDHTISAQDPTGDVLAWASSGSDLTGAELVYRAGYEDILGRIEVAQMPVISGVSLSAEPGLLFGLEFSVEGVRYQVRSQRSPAAPARQGAIFQVFRCDSECVPVGEIEGGYGTTGHELVFALPLATIGLEAGGLVSDISAFSSTGHLLTGPAEFLDSLSLTEEE